jgi:hypothetical protein
MPTEISRLYLQRIIPDNHLAIWAPDELGVSYIVVQLGSKSQCSDKRDMPLIGFRVVTSGKAKLIGAFMQRVISDTRETSVGEMMNF